MHFFFNQHTTQATPNPDVDDNYKMLKNVELDEVNILRYRKHLYEHEHPHIQNEKTCHRSAIDTPQMA